MNGVPAKNPNKILFLLDFLMYPHFTIKTNGIITTMLLIISATKYIIKLSPNTPSKTPQRRLLNKAHTATNIKNDIVCFLKKSFIWSSLLLLRMISINYPSTKVKAKKAIKIQHF